MADRDFIVGLSVIEFSGQALRTMLFAAVTTDRHQVPQTVRVARDTGVRAPPFAISHRGCGLTQHADTVAPSSRKHTTAYGAIGIGR